MKRKKPIISVAAIKYYDSNKSHNLDKIKLFIKRAKKANADIICFPESCLTRKGHLFLTHNIIREIQKECLEQNIWCIITDDFMIKEKKYNISLLIDRNGKIKGTYKKINLYGDRVLPGKKVKVFDTDFGKIGVVICWDISFPKIFDIMRKKGVEIIFCPSQWWYDIHPKDPMPTKREIKILRALVLARAFENVCFIALCNPLLDSKFQVSYSAISSPHKILKELINKEGLITSEVNLSLIKKYRAYYSK